MLYAFKLDVSHFSWCQQAFVFKWIESKHWITHLGGIEYLSIVMASASFSTGKLLLQIWFQLLLALLMCASARVSESLLFLEHWTSTAFWCLTPWSKYGLKSSQIMLRLSLFQTILVNFTYVCCPWCKPMFWLNKTEFLLISPLCVAERRRRHERT